MLRKVVVEFIGTFFLVLTIGMTVIEPAPAPGMAALAIAGMLAAMIYAGGHVSGAHYNPAVTLAVILRGKCSPADAAGYVLAQALAAVGAALLVLWFKNTGGAAVLKPPALGPVVAGEAIFTFALAYVVLNVATAKGTTGNQYFGVAIALVVLAAAYSVGPLGAGALNPAVTVGAIVMGLTKAADCWAYFLGQAVGAVLAVVVFKVVNKE